MDYNFFSRDGYLFLKKPFVIDKSSVECSVEKKRITKNPFKILFLLVSFMASPHNIGRHLLKKMSVPWPSVGLKGLGFK